jgi:hypothetical protein
LVPLLCLLVAISSSSSGTTEFETLFLLSSDAIVGSGGIDGKGGVIGAALTAGGGIGWREEICLGHGAIGD